MSRATNKELFELQKKLIDHLNERLATSEDEDSLPMDAATLGVITKLLKDNSITVDPMETDGLMELREKFKEQSKRRTVALQDAEVVLQQSALQ